MNETDRLDEVRAELRRLGYLSHRFERYLLQDALSPRGGWPGLLRLAARGGALVATLLTATATVALAAANRLLGEPAEMAALFLHVGAPTLAASIAGLLVLFVTFRAVLAVSPRRGLGAWRVALAGISAFVAVATGVALGWRFLRELPLGGRVLVAVAVPLVAVAMAKLIADALLALGVRMTRKVPPERMVRRRWIAASAVASALVTGGAALLTAPAAPQREPPALPVAPGERVALVGIDGVLADEVDYRLAAGALPHLAARLHAGGVVARSDRPAPASPAEVWTTIATGRRPDQHGVRSLDGFRLLGMRSVLSRPGPWRGFWGSVGTRLGFAEQRPLLSGVRRAPTVWELVARGGRPVVAVNWWGTYPAEPTPGLVLAHGGWEHLAVDDRSAVEPADRFPLLAQLRREIGAAGFPPTQRASGEAAPGDGAEPAPETVHDALLPDVFHRRVVERFVDDQTRAVAVYLPALDLAAAASSSASLAALVDEELAAADALVGELAARAPTLVVVFDPGRRGGGEGRVAIVRSGCAAGERPVLDLRQIAALLARAAGLPQSAELPEPPAFCSWPTPPARVASYGQRRPTAASAAAEREYLETLRSLGYL